jgi:replicative superfamily II helicase
MSAETVPTTLELSQWLRIIRACSGNELCDLVSLLGLRERLPSEFLATLDDDDLTVCYRAAIICYGVTGSVQVPREMQLKAVLSDYHGRDTFVSAGTGSGKTLPIALNVLLDDPDKNLVTITLLPLKRLQVTQETDFNTRYGIPTVVINEDTPREDSWWSVSDSCQILVSGFSLMSP